MTRLSPTIGHESGERHRTIRALAASARRVGAVLRRRKAVWLAPTLIVALLATGFALTRPKIYAASTDVALSRRLLADALTSTPNPYAAAADFDRVTRTQARIARSPEVARRALAALGREDRSATALRQQVDVTPVEGADLIEVTVRDADRALVTRLADVYAQAFVDYRRRMDTAALARARRDAEQELARLRSDSDAGLRAQLSDRIGELRTLETLQAANTAVARNADEATLVAPRLERIIIGGLLLGLAGGVAAALLRERLDSRLRRPADVCRELGCELLGDIAEVRPELRRPGALAVFLDGAHARDFRVLGANLDFEAGHREVHMVLVTSATDREQKSVVTVNLATTLALTGRQVIVIDLDFRRPAVDELFALRDRSGISDVVRGHADLDEVLTPVAVLGDAGDPAARAAGTPAGSLSVLSAGTAPGDPAALLADDRLAGVLVDLRGRADWVLLDAPPLLEQPEALELGGILDALLVVARLDVDRRDTLRALAREIASSQTPCIGWVAAGDPRPSRRWRGRAAHRSHAALSRTERTA
jgi:Mrp family chromosome partitioning ATPase